MRIEQMLHGYENGHRLLAASILLKDNKNMDTIAALSDWSEYVALDKGDSSYVTAYSLLESGYYVIARTWYADEMKRPGCVWTHSLLIPIESIDVLDDYKNLLFLFKRPSLNTGFTDYSHSIDYHSEITESSSFKPISIEREKVGIILYSFIMPNKALFFRAGNENQVTEMLLSLMNVLPQDMIKRVSWCSGSAYVRKMDGKPLTCQFLSGASDDFTSFRIEKYPLWIRYLLDGVLEGNVKQGQLIRMFSDDIKDNANYYKTIITILFTLEDYFQIYHSKEERFKVVLSLIAQGFPTRSEGRVIKSICTNEIFIERFCKSETFFYFWATLPLDGVFDMEENRIQSRLERFIKTSRASFLSLLSQISKSETVNNWGRGVLKGCIAILTKEEATHFINDDYHLFYSIYQQNPSVLNLIDWTLLDQETIERVVNIIFDNHQQCVFVEWSSLFRTLLDKGITVGADLASLIFNNLDDATAILLEYLNNEDNRCATDGFNDQLKKHLLDVLSWMGGVDSISYNIANTIASVVDEHSSEVVLRGPSIWKAYLNLPSHGFLSVAYSFMFSLSFNWPSDKTAIELMRIAFYNLHILQAKGELASAQWNRIDSYMESRLFEDWDKCKKLRRVVVQRLKEAGFDFTVLDTFTPDSHLNELLKSMWRWGL